MVFILLEQYIRKQAGVGDALVDRHQRHGGNLYPFLSLGRKLCVVLEPVFGTDDFLDVEHSRLVLDDLGHFFTYFTV